MNNPGWEKLITNTRLRQTEKSSETLPQAVASDHGRVVFSSPFRRMQQKAQVFSLETNAAVRSRLTHSIEVSHIGRFIALESVKKLELSEDQKAAIPAIVEVSCLLHDIGNPPFGHLGEAAIQKWFIKWHQKNPRLRQEHLNDFIAFDGNPQGFRIITKLQGLAGEKGLNLTCTQLMAFLKYPTSPSESLKQDSKFKKAGYFHSERSVYEDVKKSLGLTDQNRHALVYIMEAADDIAYSLSDIEDGAEKELIDVDKAFIDIKKHCKEVGRPLIDEAISYAEKRSDARPAIRIMRFRISMINSLVKHAVEKYTKNIGHYLSGSPKSIFEKEDAAYEALKAIRTVVSEKIYRSREAEDIEISGFNVIQSLLDCFCVLLDLPEADFKLLMDGDNDCCKKYPYEKRLLARIPASLASNYRDETSSDEESELFYRCHMIVDYLCGMTDDFALKIHQLLAGITVESI